MIERFIREATELANKTTLTEAETRRFSLLLTQIAELRGPVDKRIAQLDALIGPEKRKKYERGSLLDKLNAAGVCKECRGKVLRALRPDLANDGMDYNDEQP